MTLDVLPIGRRRTVRRFGALGEFGNRPARRHSGRFD